MEVVEAGLFESCLANCGKLCKSSKNIKNFVTGTQLALSCNAVLLILKNKAFHVEIFFS